MNQDVSPIRSDERSNILDVLRGFALLGIILANYPVHSLYVFQSPETINAMPTADIDNILKYIHFAFIDGKFYTIFSLLFGIGFSIILHKRGEKEQVTLKLFYRRIIILLLIGLVHALLLWDGDILVLYALLGLLLPLFRNASDKTLLILIPVLLFSPLLFDTLRVLTDGRVDPALFFQRIAFTVAAKSGITDTNYRNWLVVNDSYSDVIEWNKSGFFFRWNMLFGTNRLPKVFALFLLGLYVGRKRIFALLPEHRPLLRKVQRYSLLVGLPATIGHAYFQNDQYFIPAPISLLDTLFYALSVVPMGLFYASSISLLFLWPHWQKKLMVFAPVGRMALTNYIGQTICGTLVFYGYGWGLGATTGLVYIWLIALAVFLLQIVFSHFWLRYFQYGPLEWLWRQLTYGKWLPLVKLHHGAVILLLLLSQPSNSQVVKVEHFYASSPQAESLFRFFSRDLDLPVVWNYQSWGDFASGGVSLGNVVFEQVWFKGNIRTAFEGIALEPAQHFPDFTRVLDDAGIPHDSIAPQTWTNEKGQQVGWVNMNLPQVLPPASGLFICDYLDRKMIARGRQQAADSLTMRKGGPLGIDSLVEIEVGSPNLARYSASLAALPGITRKGDGLFAFSTGPSIRLVEATTEGTCKIVLRVRSLEQAKDFLRAKGWLDPKRQNRVFLDSRMLEGLQVELVR